MRACVPPTLLFAAFAGYLVGTHVIEANTATSSLLDGPVAHHSDWRASYSRAFPSCVALVLWPEGAAPVAFVVEHGPGVVERMSPAAAYRALDARNADAVRVIGACRAR